MTSCPTEEDLVLFVEDEAGGADGARAAEDVAEHLVVCANCRRLVARSEAALRYALGGVADREGAPCRASAEGVGGAAVPWTRRLRIAPFAAAAAVLAVAATWAALRVGAREDVAGAARGATADVASSATRAPSLDARLDALLARAERLAAASRAPRRDETTDAALAALAAAQTRLDLGLPTAAARMRDVVDRFPGTPESREARAHLAEIGDGR